MISRNIYLYGPPGSGKSTVGKQLAHNLGLPFFDLDVEIEKKTGQSISEIFLNLGETGFRNIEREIFTKHTQTACVTALGGGTLLDIENLNSAKKMGAILYLDTPFETMLERLSTEPHSRPLLEGEISTTLHNLLQQRASHYALFGNRIDTRTKSTAEIAWEIQLNLGFFHIQELGKYDVRIQSGALEAVGELLKEENYTGQLVIVSDENVGSLYAEQVFVNLVSQGFKTTSIRIPAGEQHKTIHTVEKLWDRLLAIGVDRSGVLLALGGGVVSDLVGFTAATYMRGIAWGALPTTLLSMIDASLGGKTGVDLPRGKNLAGAFHPPSFVLADPAVLATLPHIEWRCGLAEMIKHAVIDDPALFQSLSDYGCHSPWDQELTRIQHWITRAVAVKVKVIEADPLENNLRAVLNFGHTVGHAVEKVSGFTIKHGEAVSIGMAVEALLSEEIGIAHPGVAAAINLLTTRMGLPVTIPAGLDRRELIQAMSFDKKRKNGALRFSLPVKIGEMKFGVEIEQPWRKNAFSTCSTWS